MQGSLAWGLKQSHPTVHLVSKGSSYWGPAEKFHVHLVSRGPACGLKGQLDLLLLPLAEDGLDLCCHLHTGPDAAGPGMRTASLAGGGRSGP